MQNIVHGGNEFGNGGEMGPGVSGQSHKNYILLAGPFDLPAGDDASGLGVGYGFEKDSGVVGGSSGDVVFETFIKAGEIQLMINEMVQGIGACYAICYFLAIIFTNDMVCLSTKNNNRGDRWTDTNIFHFGKNGRFQ